MMNRIREIRKRAGITMKELGAKINKTEAAISMYETGKRLPDYETISAIASVLDVTSDYLMGGPEQATNETVHQTRQTYADLYNAASRVSPENIETAIRILSSLQGDDNE